MKQSRFDLESETKDYPTYREVEDMKVYFRVIDSLHQIVALAYFDDVSIRVTTDLSGDYNADCETLIRIIKEQRNILVLKECS